MFKFCTLLIIFCGLLFSFLAFYSNVSSLDPTPKYFEAISFLKEQNNDAIVLAPYSHADYIFYSGKTALLGFNLLYDSRVNKKLYDVDLLFNSTRLDDANLILDKYNIRYVLFDINLKVEEFNNQDERFLFLLKYGSNQFVPLVINGEVDLWYNRPL